MINKTLEDVLLDYSSIEDIKVRHIHSCEFNAEIKVNELNYVADILLIDRIENIIKNQFYKNLPKGLLVDMNVKINPLGISFNLVH